MKDNEKKKALAEKIGMIGMFVGEIVVAIFVIYWIPVVYIWTQPFFAWLGELIKHL